jgi:integrase
MAQREINNLRTLTDDELERELAARRLAAGGLPPENPAPKKKRARQQDAVSYLNDLELAALMRAVVAGGSARDVAIFELAYGRGLRASEVGKLKRDDVRSDSSGWRLAVPRLKHGNSGEFRLSDREVKALRAWLRIRGNEPGPLFPSRNRGPISRSMLHRLMREYGAAAELPREKQHFHCLRHTCATRMLDLGEDIVDVQDRLGHRDIRNTQRYARVTGKRRSATDERLKDKW